MRPRRRIRRLLVAACVAGLALLPPEGAVQARVPTEYEVKAAYLYNFARFVEWPEGSFPASDSPFVVAILGEDPFGPVLESTCADKKILDHPVVLRRVHSLRELDDVQILFVSASKDGEMGYISDILGERSILTVGDLPKMAEEGAVIGFRVEDDRVRFDISAARATRSGLHLSSELLKVARTVDGVPPAR